MIFQAQSILKNTLTALVAVMLTGAVAFGQANSAKALGEFSKTAGLRKAQWGFVCQDISTGKMLASRQANLSLAPASTLKTLTTSAALAVLGTEYRVTTRLCYEGSLSADGVLNGNIWIFGEGDPTLGGERMGKERSADAVLSQWVQAMKTKGIKSINGDILAWSGYFEEPHTPDGWQFGDLANYFGASVSGLSWRENFYRLTFKTDKQGSEARLLGIEPPLEGYTFQNKVKAGAHGSPDLAYIYPGMQTGQRLVKGTLPGGKGSYTIKGAFGDPALQCAQELKAAMIGQAISVSGSAQSVNIFSPKALIEKAQLEGKTLILELQSPTVKEIVELTNRHSLNLFAETLVRWMATNAKKPADTDSGCEVVTNYWKGQGMETEGLVMVDGSGLSPGNGITPVQLMQVQKSMYQNANLRDAYLKSLPVMGESGTLDGMGKGTKAQGNIHAKSGTLTRVLCYTGYVTVPGHKPAVFALMVNKYSGSFSEMKKAIEKLMIGLAQ